MRHQAAHLILLRGQLLGLLLVEQAGRHCQHLEVAGHQMQIQGERLTLLAQEVLEQIAAMPHLGEDLGEGVLPQLHSVEASACVNLMDLLQQAEHHQQHQMVELEEVLLCVLVIQ